MLVQRVAGDSDRDRAAYICEHYYGFMMYVASKELPGREADAQDAVHEAIVRIIVNAGRLDLTDEVRTKNLCAVITRHVARDILKNKNANCVPLDESFDETASDFDTEDIVIGRDAIRQIVREIGLLDEKYREVCLLRFVNGLSEREIAAVLGAPVSTVGNETPQRKNNTSKETERDVS